MVGPRGIFKPAILPAMPLSVTTIPAVEGRPRPYEDEIQPDGLIRYRYRGTDPRHADNMRLRAAMENRKPLIYFHGVVPGRYLPIWPVYIVDDDPETLTFTISVDEALVPELLISPREGQELQRAYAIRLTRQRLHQVAFRERVLRAYHTTCAICRLRHGSLLDAAHILPDGHPRGAPVVPNGLALCKLHHSAFDQHMIGVKPDLRIVIRSDVLNEVDGPMLVHGLQGFQDKMLHVPASPRQRPDRDFLAERFELFRNAG